MSPRNADDVAHDLALVDSPTKSSSSLPARSRSKRGELQAHKEKRQTHSALHLLLNNPGSSTVATIVEWLFNILALCSAVIVVINTVDGFLDRCPQPYRIVHSKLVTTPCDDRQLHDWYANRTTFSESPAALAHDCCIQEVNWAPYELFLTVVFTVELILRVMAEPRWKSVFKAYFWFDLFSVLPFYFNLFSDGQGYWQVTAAFGMFRLLKLVRHDEGTIIFARAISQSKDALMVPLTCTFMIIMIAATILYYVEFYGFMEPAVRVEDYVNPRLARGGITYSVWFMLVTFTTVGYGDVTPDTSLGKGFTILCMCIGVILVGMPLAIVGDKFTSVWNDRERVVALADLKAAFLLDHECGEMVRGVFNAIDADDSGTIDYHELEMGLLHLGVNFRRTRLRAAWSLLDPEGQGDIDLGDFITKMFGAEKGTVFNDLDSEGQTTRAIKLDARKRSSSTAQATEDFENEMRKIEAARTISRRDLNTAIEDQKVAFDASLDDFEAKVEKYLSMKGGK